ncbi:MAG: hypothetical protein U9N81_10985 [Bacillota bacterium]|nr:hypothetical protein [Bacillota bacterium]
MFASLWDYKNSTLKKAVGQDNKIDPGTFSILEPGWIALHAVVITGVYMLGCRLGKTMDDF